MYKMAERESRPKRARRPRLSDYVVEIDTSDPDDTLIRQVGLESLEYLRPMHKYPGIWWDSINNTWAASAGVEDWAEQMLGEDLRYKVEYALIGGTLKYIDIAGLFDGDAYTADPWVSKSNLTEEGKALYRSGPKEKRGMKQLFRLASYFNFETSEINPKALSEWGAGAFIADQFNAGQGLIIINLNGIDVLRTVTDLDDEPIREEIVRSWPPPAPPPPAAGAALCGLRL